MEKESFFASIQQLKCRLWFIAGFSASHKEIPSENVMFIQGESHGDESLKGVHSFMKPSRILQFNERLQTHRTRQANEPINKNAANSSSFINQIECNSLEKAIECILRERAIVERDNEQFPRAHLWSIGGG